MSKGKHYEHIVNIRFRNVMQSLINRGDIFSRSPMSHLAEKLSTYNHVIHRIVRGDSKPTLEQIRQMTIQFGVNGNYLLGVEDVPMYNKKSVLAQETISKVS